MDIAIVLSGHRHGKRAADLMLRPFAESTLLENAMAKLERLDAPCKKYVACADREIKNLCAGFESLYSVRASHLLSWPETIDARSFSHLRSLPEQWFLVVNPAFPFVSSDLWWQVIEDFLVSDPAGIVSAEPQEGPFYSSDGKLIDVDESLFVRNDAFILFSRSLLEKGSGLSSSQFAPYILTADVSRSVEDGVDLSAAEAIDALYRLGVGV
ncbi:MAG: hypothetical protein ACI97A_001199 [Planctomycetota bacterium]|jgi:hypothetical protein